jgi:hypothetical protein
MDLSYVSSLIKKVWPFGSVEEMPPQKVYTLEPPQRKKSDMTKLTQYHFDFIIYAREDWKKFNRDNPHNKKTTQDLVDTINARMGTHKSNRSIARVWCGEVDRDDLPVGKPTFDY